MGIHVHVKGRPDACGCCAVKEKLDALWDRSSGAVTSINGISPDGLGRITLELLEEAAVQGIIDDYIDPMRDTVNALSIRVQGFAPVFDDYSEIRRQVEDVIPGEIDSVHNYAAAIADDLVNNYTTSAVLASTYATRDELAGLATREDIQNVINGYVFKQGTSTPQVISGSGGLQIAGDLAVGGDITASGDTFVHWDNIRGAEIGPVTISRSAVLGPTPNNASPSNAFVTKANVMSTDGKLNNLVHTIGDEEIDGNKTFKGVITKKLSSSEVNFFHSYNRVGVVTVLNLGESISPATMINITEMSRSGIKMFSIALNGIINGVLAGCVKNTAQTDTYSVVKKDNQYYLARSYRNNNALYLKAYASAYGSALFVPYARIEVDDTFETVYDIGDY